MVEHKICLLKRLLFTWLLFFKNGPIPASFCLFSVFSNKQYNFTTNQCEKCPTSIRCRDLNPQPFEHESSTIATRPGLLLPSSSRFFVLILSTRSINSVTRWKIYFFIIWLFTTKEISPKADKICQSGFKIVPNTK